jgi:hypothetical protein
VNLNDTSDNHNAVSMEGDSHSVFFLGYRAVTDGWKFSIKGWNSAGDCVSVEASSTDRPALNQ